VIIAASTVDITPTHPVVTGGYLDGTPLSEVAERLEANLVVLRDDYGSEPMVIISLDLLYPGRILRSALESALPELRPDQIFLAATHTHQAPMTDDTKALLGAPDDTYMDLLVLGLSRELKRLLLSDETQIGEFSTAGVSARHSINRRFRRRVILDRRSPSHWWGSPVRLVFNSYLLAPNPHGVTDELITVLISRSPTGRAQFVIWNYACHPVGFPDKDRIAADFPHHVRDILRTRLGVADLPVLFLQGFSGNTRPSATVSKTSGPGQWTRRMMFGPWFTKMTWDAYTAWASELGELVADGCGNSSPLADTAVSSCRSLSATSSFVAGAAEPEVSFHSIRFGSELSIVGASAELVAEFSPKIRAMAASEQVMCVGCLDHAFGYAPTSRIRAEGGYEGGDYCSMFSLGPLAENVEEEMLQGFRAVLGSNGPDPGATADLGRGSGRNTRIPL
jgi:hypothetical protein